MRTHSASSLRGHLLIATDSLRNSMFRRSVVFLCAHSPAGAMGLVINRPARDMTIEDLVPGYERPTGTPPLAEPIHAGGPAEVERSFVLHSCDYHDSEETLEVTPTFAMTATNRILRDLVAGRGPKRRLVALGYAGWGDGQLDAELRDNAWFTVAAEPDLVFAAADETKWRGAIAAIGIDPAALSGISTQHGHA
ncbi:MAG: YqgE/AlgH family protein [Pseudomonadota bacterium]